MKSIKQWLKSWTINFGLLLEIAGVIQIYVDSLEYGLATTFVGIVIIGLRFKTNQPLSDK